MVKEIKKPSILQKVKEGFTLLEVLISISIIVILTSIVVINYHFYQKDLLLERTAYKFSQDVRKTAEMALAVRKGGDFAPKGYGLYLKSEKNRSYEIYSDKNGNEKYDGPQEIIETVNLEKGVVIKSAQPNNFSVNFKPPSPIVKLKDGNGKEKDWVQVIFSLESDPTKEKIIKINGVGMVEIE